MDGSEKSVDPDVSQTPDAKLQSSKVTNTKLSKPNIFNISNFKRTMLQ